MARKEIGTKWDRVNRNNMNDNFEELYNKNNSTQKQIDELILNDGESDLEVAQARIDSEGNSYQTLKERLDTEHDELNNKIDGNHDEVTSQFAETSQEITDLNTKIDGNHDEVTSQLAQKLNQDDILSMANMGQDIKEAMTGGSVAVVGRDAILTENIVNRQVTPEKTTFFTKTRNEFSGAYLKDMKLVGGSGYAAVEKESVGSRLAFLEVDPSTEYTMTIFDHENVLNIIAYSESTKHIDELEFSDTNNRASLVSTVISTGRNTPTTFTTKSDTKYLYIYVSNESAEPRLQVEKGSESTEYVLPYVFSAELIEGSRSNGFDDFLTTNGENWEVS